MRVIIELSLSGDTGDGLTDDQIEAILDKVIEYGSEDCCLTGRYVLKEILER
jgi:hypothetical protein